MKRILLILASVLLLFPLVSLGQENNELSSDQKEILTIIEAVMHQSEQEEMFANASPIAHKAIEAVRAIAGTKAYDAYFATQMALGLRLDNGHIKASTRYDKVDATWDGVSMHDLAKALDEYRNTGELDMYYATVGKNLKVELSSDQKEILTIIEAVMHQSEQEEMFANATPIARKAIEVVRTIAGTKAYDAYFATQMALGLRLDNGHIKASTRYDEVDATWDGVSMHDLAKALDEYNTKEMKK